MTNIDANLDLFNSANAVIRAMTEDDALFCVSLSGKEEGKPKCFASINGSIDSFGDLVEFFFDESQGKNRDNFSGSLLTMALHAAMCDDKFFTQLKNGMKLIETK